ncbi:alpha/beta hydrolase [Methylobacterium sp. CM6247]
MALAAPSVADAGERFETLKDSGGSGFHLILILPEAPLGVIVMLPGGTGDIGIRRDGGIRHGNNFVVRTRDLWLARGFGVLLPDASDGISLRGARSTARYAAIVGDLVTLAHERSPGPVFLLGTSQGSIAAMNGAAHLGPCSIAGVVLTESVSRPGGSGETVFDARPDRVRVPALVVANDRDACPVSPPEDAARIAASMSASPAVEVLRISGGEPGSKACGSLSPHGYLGIEADVVSEIAKWMSAASLHRYQ